jgi:hypothetical protein
VALDPDVLGANTLVLVERGHDDPVVLKRVREQLVKPVEDTLDLERLPEVASRVEQQLSRLGLAAEVVLHLLLVSPDVVGRLDGHVLSLELCAVCEKIRRLSAFSLLETETF